MAKLTPKQVTQQALRVLRENFDLSCQVHAEQEVSFTPEELTMSLESFHEKVIEPVVDKLRDEMRAALKESRNAKWLN